MAGQQTSTAVKMAGTGPKGTKGQSRGRSRSCSYFGMWGCRSISSRSRLRGRRCSTTAERLRRGSCRHTGESLTSQHGTPGFIVDEGWGERERRERCRSEEEVMAAGVRGLGGRGVVNTHRRFRGRLSGPQSHPSALGDLAGTTHVSQGPVVGDQEWDAGGGCLCSRHRPDNETVMEHSFCLRLVLLLPLSC